MGRYKIFFAFLISLFCLTLSYRPAYASLIHVKADGQVIVNVLASSDSLALEIPKKESLQVTDLALSDVPAHALISLNQEDGKINLNVATEDGQKNLDVTDYKDNIIEVEERSGVEKIMIGLVNNKFSISNKGVTATTEFPININPKNITSTESARGGLTSVETACCPQNKDSPPKFLSLKKVIIHPRSPPKYAKNVAQSAGAVPFHFLTKEKTKIPIRIAITIGAIWK